MKQIEIEQGFGQIGIKITPPRLDSKIKPADVEITTKPADLALKITPPSVIVDLQPSFNSMGLQDPSAFAASMAEEGKAACARGIDRRVSEGEQLTAPHGPSVGQVAAEGATPPEKQVAIGLSPSVPPQISVKLGTIQGTYTPAKVDIKVNEGSITSNFTWGRVDVTMEREPYLDIKA